MQWSYAAQITSGMKMKKRYGSHIRKTLTTYIAEQLYLGAVTNPLPPDNLIKYNRKTTPKNKTNIIR